MEDAKIRWARYQNAKSRRDKWQGILEEAYRYALPTRDDFSNLTTGSDRMQTVFDATAIEGTQNFASNLQYLLMPPFQRWMEFVPGPQWQLYARNKNISEQQLKQALQFTSETFFRYLDQSNFALAANEALQDMAISLGVILINEGPPDNPLIFQSIPIDQIAVEEGATGTLENYWHDLEVPARRILEMWPDAQLTQDLQTTINNAPDTLIKLVQSTVKYGDQDDNNPTPYYYCVSECAQQTEIVKRFMKYSPWIGFRFSRSPGEILGRGPVLTALPFIRVLNKMSEFELKAAKFQAFPILMAASAGIFNPYTTLFEPGSVIPIEPAYLNNPPIQKLDMGGNPQFAQLSIQSLQNQVKDIMFADPLMPPGQGPSQTATEVSIRQQNWLRKNAASFGRLTIELLDPVIDKVLMILNNKGLMPPLTIDNKRITIKYQSPLIDLQDQQDVQQFLGWAQNLQSLYGPYAVLAINAPQVPEWLAEKMKVNLTLVQNQSQILAAFNEMIQRFQQSQQQNTPVQGQQPTVQPNPQLTQQPGAQ